MLLLAASAFAGTRFGVSAGLETVINDPFVYRHGTRLGLSYAPVPWIEASVAAVYFPILGSGGADDPDWKPLADQLLRQNSVYVDVTKLQAELQAVVRVRALDLPIEQWRLGFGAFAGVAAVRTVEEPYYPGGEEVLRPEPPEDRWRPGAVGGLFWDARRSTVGFRFRYETVRYIETLAGSALELKGHGLLGAEVMAWF